MTISNHAAAAKAIRQELKKNGIKGSVRAESCSGGTSITVSLTNELPATVEKITTFANQYEMGSFNGMIDLYEYDNCRDDIPQVKFVFVNSTWDDAHRADAIKYCEKHHANFIKYPDSPWLNYESECILTELMNGKWGSWLLQQKPRIRA